MGSIPFPDSRESNRNNSEQHRHRRHHHHRSKRTKTPNLDHLERQRDLQPTKLNSYVQFASSKSNNLNKQASHSQYATSRLAQNANADRNLYFPQPRLANTQRVDDMNMRTYVYHGVKVTDDSFWDYYGKPYSSFSFHDPSCVYNLKQVSQLKAAELSKFESNKSEEDLGERLRCKHCQAMYNHDLNYRGSCSFAPPDRLEQGIEYASCLPIARWVFKQCFRGTEGTNAQEPCTCSHYSDGISRPCRWLILGLLSFFLPCLCLYPLLKSCHRCGVVCRCCGGRHEPISSSRDQRS